MIEWVVVAALVLVFGAGIVPIACTMLRFDEPYIPSREYAEDFAARMSGLEKPGSSRPCAFQHGEDASPGEGPGDIVYTLGAGPRDLTTRPTPAPPARRSAAETDRLYIVRP